MVIRIHLKRHRLLRHHLLDFWDIGLDQTPWDLAFTRSILGGIDTGYGYSLKLAARGYSKSFIIFYPLFLGEFSG